MAEFAAWHIVDAAIVDFGPIGIFGKKDKLSIRIDKLLDEPWACDPVHLYLFSRDPFHGLPPAFGTASYTTIRAAGRPSTSCSGAYTRCVSISTPRLCTFFCTLKSSSL